MIHRNLALVALGAMTMAAAAPAPAPSAPQDRPQRALSLDEAVARALARNESILVVRESLAAARAAALRADGAYDPVLDLQADYRHATEPINSPFSGAPSGAAGPTLETYETFFTLRQLLPTGGTLSAHVNAARDTTDGTFVLLDPAYSTSAGVAFRQPLLRGRSIDTARLGLRVAAADRESSTASLRREVNETVAEVESAYWSLVAARRGVEVREEAVRLASEQLAQTRARVEAGTVPETEISQPQAELERRRGEMFASIETVSRSENALKRLILDADETEAWSAALLPADDPTVSVRPVDLQAALEAALNDRPELGESRATLERRRAETAFARDTRKPGLDAFLSYDRLGLSGSVVDLDPNNVFGATVPGWIDGGLGRSFRTLGQGRFDDARAGIVMSIPIGNRSARGEEGVARAAERQAEALETELRKRILAEVLDAAAAVDTAAQRVEAARAGLQAARVQLGSEVDRYLVGLSTNFLVLTRQNDHSRARLDEIAALTDYRKALAELGRATGALLRERGISVDETAPDEGVR